MEQNPEWGKQFKVVLVIFADFRLLPGTDSTTCIYTILHTQIDKITWCTRNVYRNVHMKKYDQLG